MTHSTSPTHDLAVVGGGPAGLCTVLAANALAPHWRVVWCRGPIPGFLPAYGGNSDVHRLNVPVERMGLDAEAPVDFFDWLHREHPQRAVEPGQYVPRRWFGEYLAARAAGSKAFEVVDEVASIAADTEHWSLAAGDSTLTARRVALCLGMPQGLPALGAPPHWIADPWAWWRALSERGLPLGDRDTVLVVGSGLTAVDMVLGLRYRGFAGHIRVVSTAGQWSQAHAPTTPLNDDAREHFETLMAEADSARGIVTLLRTLAAQHPWRAVVDALRPHTNAVWGELALQEQRRLLRHAFGVWNRHRHRMAPDVRATLDADAALHIEAGRIRLTAEGRIERHYRGHVEVLTPALALDCRGPGFRTALAGDSLLARLVRDRVLQPNALNTGVGAPKNARLAVVGAALFGERFETVAVPELRQQAAEVVRRWVHSDHAGSASQSRGTK